MAIKTYSLVDQVKTAALVLGAAWVVFGPHEGAHSLDDADVQITGVQAADRFNFSVSAAGDVDGDGSSDVWVGAKSMSRDGGAPQGAGALFYGPLNGTLLAEEAGLMVWGDETNETWGSVDVAGVGDVNGDSRPDLVLGTSSSSDSGPLSGSATLIGEVAFDAVDTHFVVAVCRSGACAMRTGGHSRRVWATNLERYGGILEPRSRWCSRIAVLAVAKFALCQRTAARFAGVGAASAAGV